MLNVRGNLQIENDTFHTTITTLREAVPLTYLPDYWRPIVRIQFTMVVDQARQEEILKQLIEERGKVIEVLDTGDDSCDPEDTREPVTYEGIINSRTINVNGTINADCPMYTMTFSLLGQIKE